MCAESPDRPRERRLCAFESAFETAFESASSASSRAVLFARSLAVSSAVRPSLPARRLCSSSPARQCRKLSQCAAAAATTQQRE